MPSRFGNEGEIDLDRLKSILLTSELQIKNNSLYQVINQLIDAVRQFQTIITNTVNNTGGDVTALTILVTALQGLTYLTVNDETAFLANSRRLLAGLNITFDDTVPNERTINASASSLDHVVMSDGALPIPSPVDDGFGNFIYIAYTP